MLIDSAKLKTQAAQLGFSACGLAPAEAVSPNRAEELRQWLSEGCQGDMHYLEQNVEKKLDLRLLVEGAHTVVSLAVNYFSPDEMEQNDREKLRSADENSENTATWKLARYARGTDYHDVVRQMLRQLMLSMGWEEHRDGRVFVDTAPVDEKYWAQQCGLGWRGRNSQLILPGAGSYFFLGELILIHEADHYDAPATNHCGNCHACLDACPMHALRGDGTLDARRCLSYLTIEHRGEIPPEAQEQMSPCFYGCDRCADVCPWNQRFAQPTSIDALKPRPAIMQMRPTYWQSLTPDTYRELFRKSAVKRAKYDGLLRNIKALKPPPNNPLE